MIGSPGMNNLYLNYHTSSNRLSNKIEVNIVYKTHMHWILSTSSCEAMLPIYVTF